MVFMQSLQDVAAINPQTDTNAKNLGCRSLRLVQQAHQHPQGAKKKVACVNSLMMKPLSSLIKKNHTFSKMRIFALQNKRFCFYTSNIYFSRI